jgi:hypothetical protein
MTDGDAAGFCSDCSKISAYNGVANAKSTCFSRFSSAGTLVALSNQKLNRLLSKKSGQMENFPGWLQLFDAVSDGGKRHGVPDAILKN